MEEERSLRQIRVWAKMEKQEGEVWSCCCCSGHLVAEGKGRLAEQEEKVAE